MHRKNQQKKSSSKHKVFLAGHCNSQAITVKMLNHILKTIPGFKSIDIPTKKWKGYGFIEMTSWEAKQHLLSLGGIQLGNDILYFKEHKSGKSLEKEKVHVSSRRVFVQNPPQEWNLEDLVSYFVQFGELEDSSFTVNPMNKSMRFGTLLFRKAEIASQLLRLGKINHPAGEITMLSKRPNIEGWSQTQLRFVEHPGPKLMRERERQDLFEESSQRGHKGHFFAGKVKARDANYRQKDTARELWRRRREESPKRWNREDPASMWEEPKYGYWEAKGQNQNLDLKRPMGGFPATNINPPQAGGLVRDSLDDLELTEESQRENFETQRFKKANPTLFEEVLFPPQQRLLDSSYTGGHGRDFNQKETFGTNPAQLGVVLRSSLPNHFQGQEPYLKVHRNRERDERNNYKYFSGSQQSTQNQLAAPERLSYSKPNNQAGRTIISGQSSPFDSPQHPNCEDEYQLHKVRPTDSRYFQDRFNRLRFSSRTLLSDYNSNYVLNEDPETAGLCSIASEPEEGEATGSENLRYRKKDFPFYIHGKNLKLDGDFEF